jgi:DNA-binding response OmpR family regulator
VKGTGPIATLTQMNSMEKIRAILLEDNDLIRSLMSTVFESRGYEVFKFSTPAICPLQKKPECNCTGTSRCADIILSDLGMPSVSGMEFMKNQQAKKCKTPYIAMMSGNWPTEDVAIAKKLGCKIFNKPFNISEMEEWLDYVEKNIDLDRELSNSIFENSGGI